MVEDFTGVRPINVGYYWYFGITCVLAEDIWKFSILFVPNKNVILYTSNGHTYFKPNKRLKISKEFIKNWKDKFKGLMAIYYQNTEYLFMTKKLAYIVTGFL